MSGSGGIMDQIKKLFKYIKEYWYLYPFAIIFMVLLGLTQNGLAFVVREFIKSIRISGEGSYDYLYMVIKLGIINVLVLSLSKFGQDYTLFYIGQRLIMNLKLDSFKKIVRSPMTFFKNMESGEIISRLTNDVNKIQNFFKRGIPDMVKNTSMLAVAIYAMIRINYKLFLIILAAVPFMVVILHFLGKFMKKYIEKSQGKLARTVSSLQEVIQGIEVVKLFSAEDREYDKFERRNQNYLDIAMKTIRVKTINLPIVELFGYIALIVIFWISGKQILEGEMLIEDFMAFFVLAGNASNAVRRISNLHIFINETSASAKRVFEIMEVNNEILDNNGTFRKDELDGHVEFKNLYFKYDEKDILKDINLEVKPGETVAFVGASGAGKTTLVNLIPRLHEIYKGQLLIDGVDIKDYDVFNLRKHISVVSQENFLFSGSVEENIKYGKPEASKEEVIEAAKAAYAHNFIKNLSNGYETDIAERGVKISGGQRQRLAIARAILVDPEILLFDEATSSLDSESEKYVQEAIDNLVKNRTTFIVAHRLSTILDSDRIVVMDNGEIVNIGSHEDLLERSPIYQKLYDLQFNA
ncbi:MAG: ABC transporter ATP-binding protein [Candidatus Mcinerneyibacterium aminivorans]|uniref:ABC transporter ATP-binding protein n=1 Tax=Candidatus Mcinerneyibacterium aminivorans TaxID=2703815 RepID=A0A5D0MAS3_9BACT|nr:MAG: ABC transporter ATP-binding protein [Candidatus Mcinerneyibacterium aminivorans]